MCGMPCYALGKHMHRLIVDGYSVAVCDQDPDNAKKRTLRGIYNKTVRPMEQSDEFVDDKEVPLIGCCIERYMCAVEKRVKTLVSISILFPETGTILVDEAVFEDDWIRYMQMLISVYDNEHILVSIRGVKSDEWMSKIMDACPWDKESIPFDCHDDVWINHVLCKTFSPMSEDIREELGISRHPNICEAIAACIDFFQYHGTMLKLNFCYPKWITGSNKNMVYNKDALLELGIRVCPRRQEKCEKGLIDVMDKTETAFGRRRLMNRILHPITSSDVLNRYYDDVDTMIIHGEKALKQFHNDIARIPDMERMMNRWFQGTLPMSRCYELVTHLQSIVGLSMMSLYQEDIRHVDIFCDNFYSNMVTEYSENRLWHCLKTEQIMKEELDNIDSLVAQRALLCEQMMNATSFKLIENDTDGLFLQTTKKKWEMVLKSQPHLDFETMILSNSSTAYKVVPTKAYQITIQLKTLKERIKKNDVEHFIMLSDQWMRDHHGHLMEVVNNIGKLDVNASIARVALERGYCRPKIVDTTVIQTCGLRHAIIEAVDSDKLYVPVDVEIDDKKGILLYGINSSGKSSMMKSIGLAVWMAQSGMFVAADTF
ncbi:MAG: hypothetical protein EBV19_07755, partial [Flavobacteriia bacterium]|nr:hypothetical protein [Flavobacteriia bacterium]